MPVRLSAQDTIPVVKDRRKNLKLNPLKATMLAASFPGMGQIYNRKAWKVPLVYAGFGALGYALSYNSGYFNKYTKAYQDFTDNIPQTQSYLQLIRYADPKDYDPVLNPKTATQANYSHIKDLLLNQVDYFKRYRDLCYIGLGAWYLLTILDANVDASLFDYDVGENINLSLAPFRIPLYNYTAAGMSLTMTINF